MWALIEDWFRAMFPNTLRSLRCSECMYYKLMYSADNLLAMFTLHFMMNVYTLWINYYHV